MVEILIVINHIKKNIVTWQAKGKYDKVNDLKIQKLMNNQWLSDDYIYCFLKKMTAKFGSELGLEDPLILSLFPEKLKKKKNFVRVCHSYGNHWVVLTTKNAKANHAILYDSMPRREIDDELARTIRSSMCLDEDNDKITIEWRISQIQSGDWQCGYFSLANAFALCIDLKPEELVFDEFLLRMHFIDILFGENELQMFPFIEATKKTVKQNKHFVLDI